MFQWRTSRDRAIFAPPSVFGLLLGACGFALALTGSLIPRTGLVQGVLAGLTFVICYGIGAGVIALWSWIFERRVAFSQMVQTMAIILAAGIIFWSLSRVTDWQNGILLAMKMPLVESARPFTILGVASVMAVSIIFIARLFRRSWRVVAAQLDPYVPRRLAISCGLIVAAFLFWSIGNDVVLKRVLMLMDSSYAAVDRLVPSEQTAPSAWQKVGSPQSLVDWEDMGAEGRRWISDEPTAQEIAAFTGRPALDPLRIYVGLNNADSPEDRAKLALEEALRVGAFDRKTLVIAFPTGTGWMDPAAMQPLDYLTGGDVAVIATQYSYLPSWLALAVQSGYAVESADALFRTIYDHWRKLPANDRPQLYLFGLSLGMRNGAEAISWPEFVVDPLDGIFWVGPPFASKAWGQVLAARDPQGIAWAPRYGNGDVIRIRTQAGDTDPDPTPWGPMRVVYLAYPSDPIVYFSTDILWRAPAWLHGPRAPDVSDALKWYPVVTFLQMGFDMMAATSTPSGYGHVYAVADYILGWNEVLASDWSAEQLAKLTTLLQSHDL